MGLLDFFSNLVESNPYFGAGAGLAGLSLAAKSSLQLLNLGTQVGRRRLLMSLELPGQDPTYDWLLRWLADPKQGLLRSQHISLQTTQHKMESGSVRINYDFLPSTGVHYVWYKNRPVKVERNRSQNMRRTTSGDSLPFESVTLTTFGQDRVFFAHMLNKAREQALQQMEAGTPVLRAVGHEWRNFGEPQRRRPLHSVVLAEGLAEGILSDVHEFLANQEWYTDRGVPYRRGYLLTGPPGCGKTSFITALAGELHYSICMMNLSELTLTEDRLHHLLNHAPPRSIVLLEDVDACRSALDRSTASDPRLEGLNTLSTSGLLNALDGVASAEGRLLFMTSNHPERLDPAITRPGRVDLQVECGLCTEDQLYRMHRRFYPQQPVEEALEFARRTGSGQLSAAAVQGYFLMHKTAPDKVLRDVELFVAAQQGTRRPREHEH